MYLILFVVTLTQLVVLSITPIVVYLIKNKSIKGFLASVGLKRVKNTWIKEGLVLALFSLLIYSIPIFYLYNIGALNNENIAFRQMIKLGFSPLFFYQLFLYAVVKTGLSEELFFRGFLGKKLANILGFKLGNLIQGLLFGSIHGLRFISFGFVAVALNIILPTILGCYMFYVNEKKCAGSIIPSWLAHTSLNIITPLIFLIFKL